MRFKKGKFLIMYNDHLEGREAWLSEDGHFGFCKFGSIWEVVHVGTGTFLWAAKTRKDCAQWLEEKGFNYIKKATALGYVDKAREQFTTMLTKDDEARHFMGIKEE